MIVDLFAGPGGWSEGARSIGALEVGIEKDATACATRAAAGHVTIRADVAQYPTAPFVGRVRGVIASPPCPTFSNAGKGEGMAELGHLHSFAESVGKRGWFDPWSHHQWADQRTPLVLEPLRWVEALEPEWIALEQVPPVMPLWEQYASIWQEQGYSVWAGVLNAADFGVPQTRRRAFVLASRVRTVSPPEPTHCEGGAATIFGDLLPWVSMADALGWGMTECAAPTIHAGTTGDGRVWGSDEHGSAQKIIRELEAARFVQRERSGDRSEEGFDPHAMPSQCMTSKTRSWTVHRPSTTIVGSFSPDIVTPPGRREWGPDDASRQASEGAVRITIDEALVLQSFDRTYPVQGSRTKRFEQVGNAVPPVLARVVLERVVTDDLVLAGSRPLRPFRGGNGDAQA